MGNVNSGFNNSGIYNLSITKLNIDYSWQVDINMASNTIFGYPVPVAAWQANQEMFAS